MKYGGKYFNPKKYLPYQRNFIFINSERSIGKTYSTEGFLLERAIQRGEEFVYLVRTKDEKKGGALYKAFEKVMIREFPDYEFDCSTEQVTLVNENEEGKDRVILGHCIALTEATQTKKLNLPNVKWMIFDEYILDEQGKSSYINGWREPELLLKIYHTIDREEDRVVVFLLANAIKFYNPYHMHQAFKIPHTKRGEIWKNENVLYHWTEATSELKAEKSKCRFLKMIGDTDYGTYALSGEFVNDSDTLIAPRPPEAKHLFVIEYDGSKYGVWRCLEIGTLYLDFKFDPSCNLIYALTLTDHNERSRLIKKGEATPLRFLAKWFRDGRVRYVSQEVKNKLEDGMRLIL